MKDGRCPSDILSEMLPLMVSGLNVLVKMLSMSVCVLLRLSFVGSEIDGRRWLEHIMSKNSDEGACLEKLRRFTLKSPAMCMFLFFSRERVEINGLR